MTEEEKPKLHTRSCLCCVTPVMKASLQWDSGRERGAYAAGLRGARGGAAASAPSPLLPAGSWFAEPNAPGAWTASTEPQASVPCIAGAKTAG